MGTGEDFKERALRKIRSKESRDNSRRKRRLSKIFLAIDAVIILLVILYFYDGSKPEESYYTAKLDYKMTEFRFSVATEKRSGSYLFSLSFKSKRDKKNTVIFNGSIAEVEVFQDGNLLLTRTLGKGVKSITLFPAEVKSFAENIAFAVIESYIKNNSDKLNVKKRSLIQFRKQWVTFTARPTLNTDEKIRATVEFKHGVK